MKDRLSQWVPIGDKEKQKQLAAEGWEIRPPEYHHGHWSVRAVKEIKDD